MEHSQSDISDRHCHDNYLNYYGLVSFDCLHAITEKDSRLELCTYDQKRYATHFNKKGQVINVTLVSDYSLI